MKELLVPVVELFAYAAVAVGFTIAGIFAEMMSIEYLAAGNLYFAIWLAGMGLVALYAGVAALGMDEVLPRVRDTLESSY